MPSYMLYNLPYHHLLPPAKKKASHLRDVRIRFFDCSADVVPHSKESNQIKVWLRARTIEAVVARCASRPQSLLH